MFHKRLSIAILTELSPRCGWLILTEIVRKQGWVHNSRQRTLRLKFWRYCPDRPLPRLPPAHTALSWPRLKILRTENSLTKCRFIIPSGIPFCQSQIIVIKGSSTPIQPSSMQGSPVCYHHQTRTALVPVAANSKGLPPTTETACPMRLDSSISTTPELTHCRRKVTACVHVRYASRGFDQWTRS